MNNWFSISGCWLSTLCTSSIWCTLPGAPGFWPTLKGPWQAKRAAAGRHPYGHSWCHSPWAVSSSFTHYLCLSKSYIILRPFMITIFCLPSLLYLRHPFPWPFLFLSWSFQQNTVCPKVEHLCNFVTSFKICMLFYFLCMFSLFISNCPSKLQATYR